MAAPVDWKQAERIAVRIAGRRYLAAKDSLDGSITTQDLTEMAVVAEDRIEATTGLRSLLGPATVQVIDRADWIRANIASFRNLLDPVIDRWTETAGGNRRPSGALAAVPRRMVAAEIGALLGWMSGRVLGQYDLLFGQAAPESGPPDTPRGGAVYLVGPNMVALENRFGFPAEQFWLWVTLHELTHRAQFTGVEWMHEHFLGLVQHSLDLADPDPSRMLAALRESLKDRGAAQQRLRDGGIVAMVSTPEQQAMFNQIAGLMSLLEGHGDVVMNRAGADLVPSAERFARVLRERRQRANPVARLVQRLSGLEGKLNQYEAGERFIAAIEAADGERAVDRCWEHADNLPTLDEIRAPELWLGRVGVGQAVV